MLASRKDITRPVLGRGGSAPFRGASSNTRSNRPVARSYPESKGDLRDTAALSKVLRRPAR